MSQAVPRIIPVGRVELSKNKRSLYARDGFADVVEAAGLSEGDYVRFERDEAEGLLVAYEVAPSDRARKISQIGAGSTYQVTLPIDLVDVLGLEGESIDDLVDQLPHGVQAFASRDGMFAFAPPEDMERTTNVRPEDAEDDR
jgi:hypothetical protein